MNYTKEEIIENYKIKFKKHTFSKSIKITLKKDFSILVTMPIFCPFKTAREFLLKNFEKIKAYNYEEKFIQPNFKTKFESLKTIKSDTNERFRRCIKCGYTFMSIELIKVDNWAKYYIKETQKGLFDETL